MSQLITAGSFAAAVNLAIRSEIDRVIAEEEERAVAAVREKIRAQKATIVMAMMRHFDIERGGDRLIITVKDTVKD